MNENYGAAESWFGSYYELAIEVSTAPADERLRASIEQLWSCSDVVAGPWPEKEVTLNVAIPALPEVEDMVAAYGVLRIPDLGDVKCVSWVIREVGRGSDWIDLCIPTSALEPFGLAYPLVSETPCTLINAIDRALLECRGIRILWRSVRNGAYRRGSVRYVVVGHSHAARSHAGRFPAARQACTTNRCVFTGRDRRARTVVGSESV